MTLTDAQLARMAPFRPAQDREVVIEPTSSRDELGRCSFLAYWLDLEHWSGIEHRGQAFRTHLDDHIADLERAGRTVRIVDPARHLPEPTPTTE